jgi:hypothetical protein
MAAERGRAALLDRRDDLELIQAHMPGIGSTPVGSMAMKDVCDLQPRAAHRRPASPRVAASPRSMVRAGRVGSLRPGSWYWRRGVKRRCVELGVTQKCLNHANIDILLEHPVDELVLALSHSRALALAAARHWPRYGQFRRRAAGVRAALDTLEPIPSTALLWPRKRRSGCARSLTGSSSGG